MVVCTTCPVQEETQVEEDRVHTEDREGEIQPRVNDPLSLCLNKLLDPVPRPQKPAVPPPAPTAPHAVAEPMQVRPAEIERAQMSSVWQRARSGAAKTLHATTLRRHRRETLPAKTAARSVPTVSRAKRPAHRAGEPHGNMRQKVMMVMIPVLALTLVFLLKSPLKSSSAAETVSAPANAVASVVDSDVEIAWEIPAPYQPSGRDPMRSATPSVTEIVEGPALPPAPTQVELAVTGILYSQDRPSAIVDTHLVHEGQQVSGATVRKIDADGVEFEMNGQTWRQAVNR